jgi:uncharacterized Zn finger protein
VRLVSQTGEFPESWPAQRWLRLVESAAPGDAHIAGLEYAKLGQTRQLSTEPGAVRGTVQGTVISPYKTSITLPTFAHDQSERVIAAMTDQAVYAAKLLAGELPANIEDVFVPLGLRLFPEASELAPKCTCPVGRPVTLGVPPGSRPVAAAPPPGFKPPWCKHACTLAFLVAERFTTDPFLIFTLRGLPREELLERLRQRRMVAGSGQARIPVYSPLIPGVTDLQAPPLDQVTDRFWEAGPELQHLDAPVERPEVTHPLLRRLGPSPFTGARFPLAGLLATCYEMISEDVIREELGLPEPARDQPQDEEDQG